MAETATAKLSAASGASHCGSGQLKAAPKAPEARVKTSETILLLATEY